MLTIKRRKVQLIAQNIGIQIARYQANISSTIWGAYIRQMYAKVKGYIEKFKDYFSDYDKSYVHLRKYLLGYIFYSWSGVCWKVYKLFYKKH